MKGSVEGKRKGKAAMDKPRSLQIKDKVSTIDTSSNLKKKRRIKMPGSMVCKQCDSVISEHLEIKVIKEVVGEIRKYKSMCPCCDSKFVLERRSHDKYKIVEGVEFDWAGYRKQCSKRFFESSGAPGSSGDDLDVFKVFNMALTVKDTNGQHRAI